MKRRAAAMLFLAAMVMITGCEAKNDVSWTPDRTALQADETGTLTETLIDTFDQTYYSSSELESMIDEAVRTYNAEQGAEAVTKVSYTSQDGQVELVLQYRSGQDMARFNNEKAFNGSMLGAQMEGYQFDCNFRRVADGVTSEEIISNEEPLSHKEYQVLICNPVYTVEVPGKIAYVSENAVTTAEKIAAARTGTVDQADSTEDQKLLYVIYEY